MDEWKSEEWMNVVWVAADESWNNLTDIASAPELCEYWSDSF